MTGTISANGEDVRGGTETREAGAAGPELPRARGPISAALIRALADGLPVPEEIPVQDADPWSDDVQLALTVCHELHYRGWRGVDADREWDLGVIELRLQLDEHLLAAVRDEWSPLPGEPRADDVLARLAADSIAPEGVSEHLRRDGTVEQFRDYFAARSIYHLKEADPHAWAIPRLRGESKAAFVAVEFDEYGAGHGDRVHQVLFGRLLRAMDLDDAYLGHLDAAPAVVLAPVNLMSCLGLRRSRLGALIGHFAATEVTSPAGSARLLAGLERIGAPEDAKLFYREHVEADAVHELVMRDDVVAPMLRAEPWREPDVIAGIRALQVVEDRLGAAFLDSWRDGTTLMR